MFIASFRLLPSEYGTVTIGMITTKKRRNKKRQPKTPYCLRSRATRSFDTFAFRQGTILRALLIRAIFAPPGLIAQQNGNRRPPIIKRTKKTHKTKTPASSRPVMKEATS